MSWLGWVILGLIAGLIARAIIPGRQPGVFMTTILGILGALVGGYLGRRLGLGDVDEFFDLETWLLAIAGAVLVLFVYGLLSGRRAL